MKNPLNNILEQDKKNASENNQYQKHSKIE